MHGGHKSFWLNMEKFLEIMGIVAIKTGKTCLVHVSFCRFYIVDMYKSYHLKDKFQIPWYGWSFPKQALLAFQYSINKWILQAVCIRTHCGPVNWQVQRSHSISCLPFGARGEGCLSRVFAVIDRSKNSAIPLWKKTHILKWLVTKANPFCATEETLKPPIPPMF